MSDSEDAKAARTDTAADSSDPTRRDVLTKSAGGMGLALWQVDSGGWWGDDGDSGSGAGWWGEDGDDGTDTDLQRPVIFVHGGAGSATQFESQALRFSSNGYPDDYLAAFEYDSLSYGASGGGLFGGLLGDDSSSTQDVQNALDRQIDDLLAETGEDQVYAVGHSLGTSVLGEYLSNEDRAAKVATYVGLDGRAPGSQPGGVESLGVFASADQTIGGGENVHLPDHSHVQIATSEETFAEVYEFLLAEPPETTQIEVEPADEITLSGRVQQFPSNETPGEGEQLDVFEVDPATGEHVSDEPVASPSIGPDGRWGPIQVDGDASHDFRLTQSGNDLAHHHYRPPELRSNQFVHLLTSTAGEGIDQLYDVGSDHSMVIALRDKEWWGDQGASSDRLVVDGENVLDATTAPRSGRSIGLFVYDAGADQQTNLNSQPSLFGLLPFLSGIDHYVPAASPPDRTVDITSTPRGGNGLQRTFRVPNRASSGHRVSLYFPDHTQTR